jgi:cytochrome c biogenesis protein CcmG/thiol:disulfide interchange protein DsbE
LNVAERSLPATILGGLVIGLTALSAGQDFGVSFENWDTYGPIGPSDPVPEFKVRVDDGSVLNPKALEGQVSLLTFWATWCHACGLEMPVLAELEQEYAGTDLHIYGVNRDSGDLAERQVAVEAYKLEMEIGFPQIYDDGQLARAFGVEAIPHMVLIDKQGMIRRVYLGKVGERTLEKEIDRLLEE